MPKLDSKSLLIGVVLGYFVLPRVLAMISAPKN